MMTLRYTTSINASAKHVWHTMLDDATYRQWTKAFSPDSQYVGEWKEGTDINFSDPNLGGTKARLDVVKPYEKILMRHIALLGIDGSEECESAEAKKWIGSKEQYSFSETDGTTQLFIEIEMHEEYAEMCASLWPKALETLKAICEEKE